MTTTIQLERIQDDQHSSAFGIPLESIDSCLLSDITGGKGPNFLQRWGQNMQKAKSSII